MERMKIGKEKFGDFLAALDKQLYAPRKGETLSFVPITRRMLDVRFSNTTVPPASFFRKQKLYTGMNWEKQI